MSPETAFSYSKQAIRRGAFALATVAALFAANAAQAATFSDQECKVVSLISRDVVKAVGVNTLSVDFRRSLMAFMAPDGKQLTCTGPMQIATPTGADIDAFNTIGGLLAAGKNPIDLKARGLQSVARLAFN